MITAYRRRVWELVAQLLRPRAPLARALDFGAGDGWCGAALERAGLVREVTAVDVQPRAAAVRPVALYDGHRLPFADGSFELAVAVDVLHHCPDPAASLLDLARCTGDLLLLKDHVARGRLGRATLAMMDELGNRRFGVASPNRYQMQWEWLPLLADRGFRLQELIYPAPCHRAPLGWLTDRHQFLALWSRG